MVFSNLIDNAIKYTPDGGHVGVHVSNDGMYVKVSVKDDGIGMEPADRERLFDECQRPGHGPGLEPGQAPDGDAPGKGQRGKLPRRGQ